MAFNDWDLVAGYCRLLDWPLAATEEILIVAVTIKTVARFMQLILQSMDRGNARFPVHLE